MPGARPPWRPGRPGLSKAFRRAASGVWIVHCAVSWEGESEAAQRLVAEGLSGTDVVMAANDLIAVGALRAFREAGVAVPDDVSLTGFDDIESAVDITPMLTTVALPLAYAGAEAIRLALGEPGVVAHVTVEGTQGDHAHAQAAVWRTPDRKRLPCQRCGGTAVLAVEGRIRCGSTSGWWHRCSPGWSPWCRWPWRSR
ncbi:MAG: substrate-binding domain-containing protein [Umezawaea sp.]